MPIIASDFLFHSTVMRGSLRGISTDDLVRDSIHSAPQLVQLAELTLDFQLLLDALARSRVQLLFQCRILGGQFLVGLVVLFQLRPHDLYTGDILVQQRFKFFRLRLTEFLLANGDENLANYLDAVDTLEPLPDAFFNPLYEKLKMYYVTGGMPESVLMWTQARDVEAMQEALSGIIGAYERDFAKHPNVSEFPKISMIWKSVPSQLARENKKFIYKVVKEGARAREYEDALQWLVDARLVHKVYRSTAPGLPMSAYDDLSAFKIYLVDVGLLRRLAQLAPTAFGEGNRLFTEFKGALTENYVLQTLITQFEVMPRYWSQNNPPYEVDFLIQRENDIFPVEVKAEANTTSRSLRKFKELFPGQVKLRVRFSLDNLKLDDDVLNIPLFMADQADRLIGLALEKKA